MNIIRIIVFWTFCAMLLVLNSCKEDCYAEPGSIWFNEELQFKIINKNNLSVFNNDYSIDSLTIEENMTEIEFEFEDSVLIFSSIINDPELISQSWDESISTSIMLHFDKNETDTIKITLLPSIYPDKCNMIEYRMVSVEYNLKQIMYDTHSSCITCDEPVIIKI